MWALHLLTPVSSPRVTVHQALAGSKNSTLMTNPYTSASLACTTANLLMDHDSCLYSQWFPGDNNIVTDSLSWDTHLDDASLLTLLMYHMPEQIPEGFYICPLLPKLISQIMTWLHNLLALTESLGAPLQSKLTIGATEKPS